MNTIMRFYYLLRGMSAMILSTVGVYVMQSIPYDEGVPTLIGDFLNIFVVFALMGYGFLEFLIMSKKQQNADNEG